MKSLVFKFAKFTSVGALGTIAHYTVLIFLVQIFAINPVIASSLGALTGAVVNYYFNYIYTFRSNKRHHEAITKFFIVAAIGFLVNGAIMAILVEGVNLQYLIAQVITTGCVLLWTFTGNLLWTFRQPRTDQGSDAHES